MEESKILWGIVTSINKSWAEGDIYSIKHAFHENVVVAGPDYQHLCESKEDCIKSYEHFANNTKVKGFKEFDPVVDVFGLTAVVSYTFDVQYKMNDKDYDEKGKEVLVFSKESGKWLIVWRMLVPVQADS